MRYGILVAMLDNAGGDPGVAPPPSSRPCLGQPDPALVTRKGRRHYLVDPAQTVTA